MAQKQAPPNTDRVRQEMERLLSQASVMLAESDGYFADLGISRQQVDHYIHQKVPERDKAMVKRELAAWEQEVQQELDGARLAAKPRRNRARRPRLHV